MKTSSKFSSLLGLLGAVLLCGSILLCLLCAKASPLMLGTPQNALDVTEAFAQALRAGDPASAGALLSGQPRLTFLPEEDSMTVLLWDAYTNSLQIEFQDQELEQEVINCEVANTNDRDPVPACLSSTRKDSKHYQVDKAAGKGHTNTNI